MASTHTACSTVSSHSGTPTPPPVRSVFLLKHYRYHCHLCQGSDHQTAAVLITLRAVTVFSTTPPLRLVSQLAILTQPPQSHAMYKLLPHSGGPSFGHQCKSGCPGQGSDPKSIKLKASAVPIVSKRSPHWHGQLFFLSSRNPAGNLA